jgi:hypothetical protein
LWLYREDLRLKPNQKQRVLDSPPFSNRSHINSQR